jgi:hypothetical protein
MLLKAGDEVRIIEDAYENPEYDIVVIATKGSIGKVLSYSEYCDHIHKIGAGYSQEYFSYVKTCIDKGTNYPIRFVKVVIPPKGFYDHWNQPVNMGCRVRRVYLLGVRFFEKI